MKRIAIALAASALLAGGAIAQTPAPQPTPNAPVAPPAAPTAPPAPAAPPAPTARTVPGSGASAVRPVQSAQEKTVTQMLASDVLKANVYDGKENKIGVIDDVLMSRNGAPEQAIVGVGGFLGIGEKEVVIPFSELKIKSRGGKSWFELARTKAQLENAAAFDVKSHKVM
ncbi:MAG: PRC-barrel domain-containing protein [Hyphomicrobiales bacterium]|nr:PRC-barrel domain-containing protein [Hyphomicrobiales bacterium]